MKVRWWHIILLLLAFSSYSLAQGQTLFIMAQGGSPETGGTVKTLELKIDQVREISWEAAIGMGKTWYVDDTPSFLIGTKPGLGDIVTFTLEKGYEHRRGKFTALPGIYYVTARAGHGVKNALGDIREYQVYGDVRGWITLE